MKADVKLGRELKSRSYSDAGQALPIRGQLTAGLPVSMEPTGDPRAAIKM